MLAKEIKINNLKRQREAIMQSLPGYGTSVDHGDTSFIYFGELYPENLKYFQDEGFDIRPAKATKTIAKFTVEVPAYIFTVGNVKLSPEELKQAEGENKPKKDVLSTF